MSAPGRSHRLTIEGPVGVLETILDDPGAADEGGCYAVVCHPHPLFGGTMDNKVVWTLARAMNLCGIPSLRFNYRGVAGSAGCYDEGLGESADADAVAAWGAERFPGRRLIAAGFSFGAMVALRLSRLRSVSRLIMVAPPAYRFGLAELPTPSVPWLIVQGDADDVVDARKVAEWADAADPKPKFILMPGVGHFFHGHLHELRAAVVDEIRNG
jgi:alpha/beta superfamily hydrolase